jgi:hypothetical protein
VARVNRRPVYITPGRHPFEVAPLFACAVVGGVMTAARLRPPSLLAGYPQTIITAWLLLVALGGLVGLIGAYWRGAVDDGMLIEFAGVASVAAACLLYCVALYATQPITSAFTAAGLLSGLGAGALWRAAQIVLDWRRVRAGVVQQVRVELPLLVEGASVDEPDQDRAEGER